MTESVFTFINDTDIAGTVKWGRYLLLCCEEGEVAVLTGGRVAWTLQWAA